MSRNNCLRNLFGKHFGADGSKALLGLARKSRTVDDHSECDNTKASSRTQKHLKTECCHLHVHEVIELFSEAP